MRATGRSEWLKFRLAVLSGQEKRPFDSESMFAGVRYQGTFSLNVTLMRDEREVHRGIRRSLGVMQALLERRRDEPRD